MESLNFLDSEPTSTRFQIIAVAVLVSTFLLLLIFLAREPLLVWFPTFGVITMAASQAGWFSVKQRYIVPAYFLFIPVAKFIEPRNKIFKLGTFLSFLVSSAAMTWWISLYYEKWL